MSFNNIAIMAGYVFQSPEINMWNDWWWLVGVSSKTIVIFTFNMLLFNEKLCFRKQKDLQLIYLWASITLQLWLDMYFNHQKSICGMTGDDWLVFPAKPLLYSLSICYC